jgi:Flp pilus assembly protein TadG
VPWLSHFVADTLLPVEGGARSVKTSRARARSERGASLVEMAIVIPVLLLIVFGIIEFGFAINHNIDVTQGVREAARQGTVANFSGGIAGCTSGTPNQQLYCFTKNRIGLDQTKTQVMIIGPGTNQVGQQFSVCASYPVESLTGLLAPFLSGRFLHSETTMRLEQAPATGLVNGNSGIQPGDSWSWCT